MKIAIMFIILLTTLFPSIVYSGEIYGCIKKGGKFIKEKKEERVKIKIIPKSNKEKTYSTDTDEYGIYRLYVPETGSCILNMEYQKRPVYTSVSKEEKKPDFLVYSYKGSVQYDFFIEEKDGEYLLRRK